MTPDPDQTVIEDEKPSAGIDAGSTLLAAHVFKCAICPEPAGTVNIWLEGSAVKLDRRSFTGSMSLTIPNESVADTIGSVVRGDHWALFEFDLEICPFLCNICDVVICGKHWIWWNVFDDDGWQDSVRGYCPQGHERMLED
ncbi:hypothetical protein BH10ACI2_BH10ACI2_21540 [soil metagenome]